ncbi:hypothetical protein ACJD0Z_15445 [Flavobacteriaceae bacterium M23B6Z8]
MKKLIYMAVAILFSVTAIAQQRPEEGQKKKMQDFTPEQIAIIHTKKMTLALDLSEQQQTALLQLNTQLAIERKQHHEEMKALKAEGNELTSQQRFEKINERLDRQIEIHNQMKSLLNKEQYTLWKEHQLKKGKKMRKHRLTNKRNG